MHEIALGHESLPALDRTPSGGQFPSPTLVTNWSSWTPDEKIMECAASHDFVVSTHDLDFSAILAATKGEKPRVVQLRAKNISPEAAGETVVIALRQYEEELTAGALITVDADRARARLLPLPLNQ